MILKAQKIKDRSSTVCNMPTIQLNDMDFFAFHGLYPEEQKTGNKFRVNLKVEIDDSFVSEDINTTTDYTKLYELVQNEMKEPRKLLESIAQSILSAIETNHKTIKFAEVTISKLNPPIQGTVGSSSVTLNRYYF